MGKIYSCLTWVQRLQIEQCLKAKVPAKDIAVRIGVHISTIYSEIGRGRYRHTNTDLTTEMRYSPDIAEQKYRDGLSIKGAPIKLSKDFDFADEGISSVKKEYVEFARERLLAGTRKPYFRVMSMLYYIKALYGQTNIAFNLEGNNRKTNILLGNDYVTRLERYTDVRALKAYVLSLRAYRFIIDGDVLDMSQEERLKTIEKDLIYATKWDEENYLALYALGLVYLNKSYEKYDIIKSVEIFNQVTKLKNKTVGLDKYLSDEEKERIISLAEKKINTLK